MSALPLIQLSEINRITGDPAAVIGKMDII